MATGSIIIIIIVVLFVYEDYTIFAYCICNTNTITVMSDVVAYLFISITGCTSHWVFFGSLPLLWLASCEGLPLACSLGTVDFK